MRLEQIMNGIGHEQGRQTGGGDDHERFCGSSVRSWAGAPTPAVRHSAAIWRSADMSLVSLNRRA